MKRLTTRTSGAGCGVKVGPMELEALLAQGVDVPREDAAVFEMSPSVAQLHTVDVITPVVDDPRTWGRITALHAMNDIWAMGGKPSSALVILCWPRDMPIALAADALAGIREECVPAGCVINGGHTLYDEEPKLGLAVLGSGSAPLFLKSAAQAGDAIYLSKPLGTGICAANLSATGVASSAAEKSMLQSNEGASRIARDAGALAATDVSGFGLLWHAASVALASNVRLMIEPRAVPVLVDAALLAGAGMLTGGMLRNMEWAEPFVEGFGDLEAPDKALFCDAQVNGGLLTCAAPGVTGLGPQIGSVLPRGEEEAYIVLC